MSRLIYATSAIGITQPYAHVSGASQASANPSNNLQTLGISNLNSHSGNGVFSVGSNVVTVNCAGLYSVSWHIAVDQSHSTTHLRAFTVVPQRDGTAYRNYGHFASNVNTPTTHDMFSGTTMMLIAHGQTIGFEVRLYDDTGSNTTRRHVQLQHCEIIRVADIGAY